MEQKLTQLIGDALRSLGTDVPFVLERPADLTFGDYATNAALTASKALGKSPREVAELLLEKLGEAKPADVERFEIAGPGFINIHLTPVYFQHAVASILEAGNSWGMNENLSGMKALVEYTDPNPFKEFHIGHLMSNTIGESISRLVKASGAEVKCANYQGDVGMHVAKAIWGMQKLQEGEPDASAWGKAYALGATAFEDDERAQEEIKGINKAVYERSDAGVNALYDQGRKVSLEHFEELYALLGTTFDFYFFESETGPIGTKLVKENIGRVFSESDGAVVFDGAKAGLHTRVFLNSQGLPTYEAKELGLAKLKQERWPHDLTVVVTANEINEYFRVLIAALDEIEPAIAKKIRHVGHGFMRLPSGKMSSRTGTVITGESLLEELQEAVREKMEGRDVPDREKVIGQVAVAAIKYAILKQAIGKDIIFEKEQALSFEGDSGPYLQYAHVRACSVLQNAREAHANADARGTRPGVVSTLERLLPRFPEVVLRAAAAYDPHFVANYLMELAGAWSSFYAAEKIVDMSPEMPYKIALAGAFRLTMKNGLALLGMAAPERM